MADIYRVGVSIALANGISPVLAIIGRDMLGLHTNVRRIEAAFGGWARAIGGVGALLAGGAIAGGLAKIAQHGEKLLDQQVQLRNLGVEQNEILKIQKDYYDNVAKAVPTSQASSYLKMVKELRAVTGSTEEAARLAPKGLKVDALLTNMLGMNSEGEYYKLLRSEEMKGISTDPAKREAFTDAAFKYILAFGGKLKAQDFQTLARRGGAAFMNMKPEALGPTAVLTADLGGDATGTAMMTFQQLMTGATTMSKQQGRVWQDLGLLDMSKVTKSGFGNSRLQLGLGAIRGSQQFSGDLPGYIKNVMWPAIERAAGGDEGKREEIIAKLAPNRNANKLVHMYGQAGFQDQIQKDLGLANQVLPIDEAYKNFITNNPKGVKQAFNDQYNSMMEAIGSPLMQAALPIMRGVTSFFTEMGRIANEHPEAIKTIGIVMAGIAAALVTVGAIALGSLVAVPVAIGAVVGALTALVALNWDSITNGIGRLVNALKGLLEWATSLPDKLRSTGNAKVFPGGAGEESGNSLKHNESLRSFNPNPVIKATPISLSLNVDGRTLAQTMSQQLDYLYEHATGAPANDGYRRFSPVDGGAFGT